MHVNFKYFIECLRYNGPFISHCRYADKWDKCSTDYFKKKVSNHNYAFYALNTHVMYSVLSDHSLKIWISDRLYKRA